MTLEEAKQRIKVGRVYKHYKGRVYKVDFIALNKENNEPMVVYHSLETSEYFVRPASMWLENIPAPRFTLLGED